jgi:malate dehydrogenase (oxaloacetate-decarboxylating)(NADP+)
VVVAGVLSTLKKCNKAQIADHTFLFYGAGEAGVGIGMMISEAIAIETGCTLAEAEKKVWFVDSKGLITNAREDKLAHHKLPFAHTPPEALKG